MTADYLRREPPAVCSALLTITTTGQLIGCVPEGTIGDMRVSGRCLGSLCPNNFPTMCTEPARDQMRSECVAQIKNAYRSASRSSEMSSACPESAQQSPSRQIPSARFTPEDFCAVLKALVALAFGC